LYHKRYTGKTINAINLGSYNYLGFAEKTGPCATDAINAIKTFGVATCNPRIELGENHIFTLLKCSLPNKNNRLIKMCHYFFYLFF